MAAVLHISKKADAITKDIVNGYIKRQQILLPYTQNAYYVIPSLVTHLVIAYFYNPEFFTDHDANFIQVNEAKDTATYFKGNDVYKTVYGNVKINKESFFNKFIWEYRITRESILGELIISIGLDASGKKLTKHAFDDSTYNKGPFYAFESELDEPKAHARDWGLNWYEEDYGIDYSDKRETHVIMEFDTKRMILKYYVNGKDQGIAFDDKQLMKLKDDVNYIAAICMDNNVSVQLLRFEQALS